MILTVQMEQSQELALAAASIFASISNSLAQNGTLVKSLIQLLNSAIFLLSDFSLTDTLNVIFESNVLFHVIYLVLESLLIYLSFFLSFVSYIHLLLHF